MYFWNIPLGLSVVTFFFFIFVYVLPVYDSCDEFDYDLGLTWLARSEANSLSISSRLCFFIIWPV